jgi:hypothetical protein
LNSRTWRARASSADWKVNDTNMNMNLFLRGSTNRSRRSCRWLQFLSTVPFWSTNFVFSPNRHANPA